MAFFLWNWHDYFRCLPPIKYIIKRGKRKWDEDEHQPTAAATASNKIIFTMPSFARQGRWGNIVFQYLFIRVLAQQNNADIELNRVGTNLNRRMSLYSDMKDIRGVQTKPGTMVLDNYRFFPMFLNFIPHFIWRALYVTQVRLQKCFMLNDVDEAINNRNVLPGENSIEVEGLFLITPKFYCEQHRDYIMNNLLQPTSNFKAVIDEGVQRLGTEKTLIGIHIRRGDYVQNPLGNLGQIPIPVKFILRWLTGNIASVKNPVIYVCSDDPEAYKEIEKAGFEVFTTRQLLPEGSSFLAFEQLDWEILRRCDILITSNSSFSFSSALLSTNSPKCYKFSLREKVFVPFDPWTSEPLEFLFSSPYVWGYLYSRFKLVWQMVSAKAAFVRLFKDVVNQAVHFLVLRVIYLRYTYGFSIKFFTKLINVSHLFQLYSEAPLADNKYHIPFGKETPERKVQEGQNEFSV